MEMVPKVGLGELRFGMTPVEVRSIFPEQEMYEEWMGGNLNDSLLYHGLILSFDECDSFGPLSDSRLNDIIIQGRNDIQLWGVELREWTRTEFVAYLDRIQISHKWYGRTVCIPEYSISATFTDSGRLESFAASPP